MVRNTHLATIVAATVLALVPAAAAATTYNKANQFLLLPTVGGVIWSDQHDVTSDGQTPANNFLPMIGVGYNFTKNWGANLLAGWGSTHSEGTSNPQAHVTTDMYLANGQYTFFPERRLEPYLFAGTGIEYISPSHNNLSTQVVFDGGAGVQYFISDRIAFKSDVRDVYGYNENSHDVMFTAGVLINFGGDDDATPVDDKQVAYG